MASSVEHHVVARREGGRAVLTCQACAKEQRIGEGEFTAIQQFLQEHRACLLPANPLPTR